MGHFYIVELWVLALPRSAPAWRLNVERLSFGSCWPIALVLWRYKIERLVVIYKTGKRAGICLKNQCNLKDTVLIIFLKDKAPLRPVYNAKYIFRVLNLVSLSLSSLPQAKKLTSKMTICCCVSYTSANCHFYSEYMEKSWSVILRLNFTLLLACLRRGGNCNELY